MKSIRFALFTLVTLLSASAMFADGPFQFYALTPCRVFDTRVNGGQTTGAALVNTAAHYFTIQGNCGVPSGAKAATLNVTVVSPNREGFVSIRPANAAGGPQVSTINYIANEPALANGAIIPLAFGSGGNATKDIRIDVGMAQAGSVHLIVDVTGYFQ